MTLLSDLLNLFYWLGVSVAGFCLIAAVLWLPVWFYLENRADSEKRLVERFFREFSDRDFQTVQLLAHPNIMGWITVPEFAGLLNSERLVRHHYADVSYNRSKRLWDFAGFAETRAGCRSYFTAGVTSGKIYHFNINPVCRAQ